MTSSFQRYITFAVVTVAVVLQLATVVERHSKVFEGVQIDDADYIMSALEKDPDLLNAIGVGGQTPLIHAVLTGKTTAVQTLLEAGADTTLTEKDGYNLFHAAGFQGRAEILEILLTSDKVKLDPMEKHADGYYPIHRACWGSQPRHTETLKVFLDHGISPTLASTDGKTCAEMTRNEGSKALLAEYENGKPEKEL